MTERFEALNNGPSYAFSVNKKPKCPHCGSDFNIEEGEAWFLYDEQISHCIECRSCNMEFQVNSIAIWSFSTDEQEDEK